MAMSSSPCLAIVSNTVGVTQCPPPIRATIIDTLNMAASQSEFSKGDGHVRSCRQREHWVPEAEPPGGGQTRRNDLPEAARIVRLAFGTLIGVPYPDTFWDDRDYAMAGTMPPTSPPSAQSSMGHGRLQLRDPLGKRRVPRSLDCASRSPGAWCRPGTACEDMEQFDSWGTRHVGPFTFPHSAKHIARYQKYGFSARFLTAIMSAKAVRQTAAGWSRFSELSQAQREEALQSCRDVAETVYPGLDLSDEMGRRMCKVWVIQF